MECKTRRPHDLNGRNRLPTCWIRWNVKRPVVLWSGTSSSSETQGQIVGAGESRNGRGKKNSGTNQKPGWRRPFGTGLVRRCPQGLFSPFFIFLRATFSRPFRLSLAPTICPWVSEGGTSFSFHFISFHEPLVYCCDCEFWITCNWTHPNVCNISSYVKDSESEK